MARMDQFPISDDYRLDPVEDVALWLEPEPDGGISEGISLLTPDDVSEPDFMSQLRFRGDDASREAVRHLEAVDALIENLVGLIFDRDVPDDVVAKLADAMFTFDLAVQGER